MLRDLLERNNLSYVYWTVHHLDSWIKRDQLGVTCFIISLFNAQHVLDVNTSILSSLRLICWVISTQSNTTHEIIQQISRKLLRMNVLTSKTCWALNKEIIKQVTSSWSLFIQLETIYIKSKLKLIHLFTNFVTTVFRTCNKSNQITAMKNDPVFS